MADRIVELKERLAAQEAYGKWNTAPLANEIARLEYARMSPARKCVHHVMQVTGLGLLLVLGYTPIVLPLIKLFWG